MAGGVPNNSWVLGESSTLGRKAIVSRFMDCSATPGAWRVEEGEWGGGIIKRGLGKGDRWRQFFLVSFLELGFL